MPTAPGARGPLLHASPNEYIVLGDNRPGSRDSREFGPVPRRHLKPEVRQQILWRRIPAASLSPWPSKVRRLICHGWKRCTAKEANPFLGAVLNEALRFSCLLVSPASVLPISAVSHPVRAAGSRIARTQGF